MVAKENTRRERRLYARAMRTHPKKAIPNLAHDATWNAVIGRVMALGTERFHAETDRMRRLGILDEKGQTKSKKWPEDMAKDSKTDVAT